MRICHVDKIALDGKFTARLAQETNGWFEMAIVSRANRKCAVPWTMCKDFFNEYLSRKNFDRDVSTYGYSTSEFSKGFEGPHSMLFRQTERLGWKDYGLSLNIDGIARHIAAGLDQCWAALKVRGYDPPDFSIYYDKEVVEVVYDNEFWEYSPARLSLMTCFARVGKELADMADLLEIPSSPQNGMTFIVGKRAGAPHDMTGIAQWAACKNPRAVLDTVPDFKNLDTHETHHNSGIAASVTKYGK